MARDKTIKILRTTKANLNTQAASNNLIDGEPYHVTDEARIAVGTGVNSYSEMAKKSETIKKVVIPHTWAVAGEIKVPSGDTDYIVPFFVKVPSGQSVKIISARHRINSGTSVTCKLTKNGSDITGFTSISVTTTSADTDPADVTLANNDLIALVVTAVGGTPKNLTFTLFLEYEV